MRIFSRCLLLHLRHTEVRMTAKRLLQEDRKTTKRLNLLIEANGVKSGMTETRAAVEGEDHTSKFKPLLIVRPKNPLLTKSVAAVVRRLIKTTE